jgi:segregation and condensation protein A
LDLLLYLIRRDGVDVRDIPIAHVTTEYLAVLERMRELDLTVAGEFLVMASTLCQLKSRELLPREERELEEEEEDPKERLVRRLIDYERFKEAAEELGRRCWLGRDLFARPRTGAEIERPLARDVEALALAEAFSALVQKAKEPAPKHEITLERWSLVQGVEWLLDTLPQGEPVALQGLFTQLDTREQRIQTFMAVLEMAKIQLVDVTQSLHLGPVDVTCLVDAKSADLSSLQDAEQGENRPAIEAQNAKRGA